MSDLVRGERLGDGVWSIPVDALREVSTDPLQQARVDVMNETDVELGDLEAELMTDGKRPIVVVVHWPTIEAKLEDSDV